MFCVAFGSSSHHYLNEMCTINWQNERLKNSFKPLLAAFHCEIVLNQTLEVSQVKRNE